MMKGTTMSNESGRMELGEGQGNNRMAINLGLLMLRVVLGWVFVYHGSQKLFGAFGGPGIEAFAKSLTGLPGFLPPIVWADLAALSEFFGGICILLGIVTRLSVIPIIVTMLVAMATVHGRNGFGGFYDKAAGWQMGYEYNLVLLAMAGCLLLTGPGLVSVDSWLFKRGMWARGPQPIV